jgi:hypothetical protein
MFDIVTSIINNFDNVEVPTAIREDHFKVKKNQISARCERLQSVSTVTLVFISTKMKWI